MGHKTRPTTKIHSTNPITPFLTLTADGHRTQPTPTSEPRSLTSNLTTTHSEQGESSSRSILRLHWNRGHHQPHWQNTTTDKTSQPPSATHPEIHVAVNSRRGDHQCRRHSHTTSKTFRHQTPPVRVTIALTPPKTEATPPRSEGCLQPGLQRLSHCRTALKPIRQYLPATKTPKQNSTGANGCR